MPKPAEIWYEAWGRMRSIVPVRVLRATDHHVVVLSMSGRGESLYIRATKDSTIVPTYAEARQWLIDYWQGEVAEAEQTLQHAEHCLAEVHALPDDFTAEYVTQQEAQRAERDARPVGGGEPAQPEAAPQPPLGVVVDTADVDAMRRVLARKQWKLSDSDLREALVAALTSAQTVPLTSAVPVRWLDDRRGTAHKERELAAAHNDATVTPLYAGIPQPAQPEDPGAGCGNVTEGGA